MSWFRPSCHTTNNRDCDGCGRHITSMTWMHCFICGTFDLCEECYSRSLNETDYLAFLIRNQHVEIHEQSHKDRNSVHLTSVDVTTCGDDRPEDFVKQLFNRTTSIKHDYGLYHVLTFLQKNPNQPAEMTKALSDAIFQYHVSLNGRQCNILSLDGGGIRGYMSIQLVRLLCYRLFQPAGVHPVTYDVKCLNDACSTPAGCTLEMEYQKQFRDLFPYIVGTSSGGLVGFALSVNYPLRLLTEIYSDFTYYFKLWDSYSALSLSWVPYLGQFTAPIARYFNTPVAQCKYDPSRIDNKIERIVKMAQCHYAEIVPEGDWDEKNPLFDFSTKPTMTLAQLDEYLNRRVGPATPSTSDPARPARLRRVFIATAYDATNGDSVGFRSNSNRREATLVSEVLKATKAAPTYFPAQKVGENVHVDGGIFANDPELVGYFAAYGDLNQSVQYRIFSLGTGHNKNSLPKTMGTGALSWFYNQRITNTFFDANQVTAETQAIMLSYASNVKRFKFNVALTEPMNLDDITFVSKFDKDFLTGPDAVLSQCMDGCLTFLQTEVLQAMPAQ